MNTYELMKEAIKNKKQVVGEYKGYEREMCPHILGKKYGKEHALCYLFSGESQAENLEIGSEENWRCIQLQNLYNAKLRDGDWYTSKNYKKGMEQNCIEEIEMEVEIDEDDIGRK